MSLKSFAALSLLLMSAGTQAAADAGSLRPKARPAVQVHGVHLRELLVTPVSLRPQARAGGDGRRCAASGLDRRLPPPRPGRGHPGAGLRPGLSRRDL